MVVEVTLTYRIPSQSHYPIRYGSKTRSSIPRLPTLGYSMYIKTHHYSGHTYSNCATLLSTVAGLTETLDSHGPPTAPSHTWQQDTMQQEIIYLYHATLLDMVATHHNKSAVTC